MEATQHAIDHPATLLIVVAVGEFNRLVDHRGWCPQAFQVNRPTEECRDQSAEVASVSNLHHLIQACIDSSRWLSTF